jgi:hypothetical protein
LPYASGLLLSRVVGGIDVGEAARANTVQLNDGFLACPCKVLDALRCDYEAARFDRLSFALVELLAEAIMERS